MVGRVLTKCVFPYYGKILTAMCGTEDYKTRLKKYKLLCLAFLMFSMTFIYVINVCIRASSFYKISDF